MTEQLGRYEILDELGQGGFAIVYRGRDTELDRLVALKELRPTLILDEAWIRRFRREAITIARLDHPNIVPIYDVYDTQNRLFIVMRLIEGPSLEDLITTRGRLPWSEGLEIITAVAEGLQYAHRQGILHRDLKPANILIDKNRGPMLSDFGLAKLTGEASLSASGGVVGTPHYIAPEVWEGRSATERSDIYALGCILFEMLTGEKVFKGDTPPAVMMAHFRPVELPRVWPDDVPANVARVLNTALAQRPAERYATVTEMSAELNALEFRPDDEESSPEVTPVVADIPPVAQPVTPPPAAPEITETLEPAPPVEPMSPAPPSSPFPAAALKEPSSAVTSSPKSSNQRTCLWVSIAAIIGIIILGVGAISTLCSTVGTTLDQALATVQVGSTVTEQIHIPLPDSTAPTNLTIDFGFGSLKITPGAENMLVDGTATYNVSELKPKFTIEDNDVQLQAETGIGLAGFTTSNIENKWDLKLADTTLDLTVAVGGAESNIELGGLALENLTITHGGANFNLSFSQPNLIEMDTLEFGGGASNAALMGLANTRADNITFEGGAGSYTLDFSGVLQTDTDVTVKAGLGSIIIIVPEGVNAEASYAGTLSNIKISEAWQKSDDRYILPGDNISEYKITFDIEMGPGTLELRTE